MHNACSIAIVTERLSVRVRPQLGASYGITQPETIEISVPATTTTLGVTDVTALGLTSLKVNPELVIRPRAAVLSGSLVSNIDEASVRLVRHDLFIRLEADEFVIGMGHICNYIRSKTCLFFAKSIYYFGVGH